MAKFEYDPEERLTIEGARSGDLSADLLWGLVQGGAKVYHQLEAQHAEEPEVDRPHMLVAEANMIDFAKDRDEYRRMVPDGSVTKIWGMLVEAILSEEELIQLSQERIEARRQGRTIEPTQLDLNVIEDLTSRVDKQTTYAGRRNARRDNFVRGFGEKSLKFTRDFAAFTRALPADDQPPEA